MAIKLTEWRLKMTENVGSILSKLNGAADKTSIKMEGIQTKLSGSKFNSFAGEVPMLNRIDALSSGYALAGAGAAAAGALMYKSAEAAMDYDTALAKVNATAQLAPPALAELKAELMDIGENSGGNFMRIPDAFEKINSQVNNVSKSLEILKVANGGAKAGFVDIDLAAGALAQTLSIVGDRDTAAGIMDTLLKAKAVGAGEFQDFATYLPQLIASGDNMNLGHKDVAGLFSYMTAKGQSAGDSAMLLQNAFTAMGKSDIQQGFAKQGIKLFDKEGNIRDLGVFFGELQKKLGHFNAESKSNWLESVGLKDAQAKNAFSVLAGDADKLKSVMAQVRDGAGELNRQLEMTGNYSREWKDIGDDLSKMSVKLGDFLLPVVDTFIQAASGISKGLKELFTLKVLDKESWRDQSNADIIKASTQDRARTEAMHSTRKAFGITDGRELNSRAELDVYQKSYSRWMDVLSKSDKKNFGDSETVDKLKPKIADAKEKFTIEKKQKKQKNITEGLNGVSQGGQRIINIQFGKLNENIIIQPQTLKEGTSEVVLNMEDMLVRIIEGAEVSVANE